jgi:hypothetical protein
MVDLYPDPEKQLETLSVLRVLEGLIHNINTPLNVIIGYSQQLKKQYPEIKYLDSITDAGLQIDDLVQVCSGQLAQKLVSCECSIDLKQWLQNELKLLKNILAIKHSLQLEDNLPDEKIHVLTNPSMLGALVDNLVLFVMNNANLTPGNNKMIFNLQIINERVCLRLNIPECAILKNSLPEWLDSNSMNNDRMPFKVMYNNDNELLICFNGV